MRETALIVEVPEADDIVSGWRLRCDPVASLGIPAHVTALYPFTAPETFDETIEGALSKVVHECRPFDYRLVAVDEFPGTVWLRPDPDEPFRQLTRALWAAFPEHPPYGGRFPDSQPHLTLAVVRSGEDQAALAGRIRAEVVPRLPIRCTAEAVSVFMTDDDGIWHREHRLGLRR